MNLYSLAATIIVTVGIIAVAFLIYKACEKFFKAGKHTVSQPGEIVKTVADTTSEILKQVKES
jgi:hypothetical protein